MELDLSIGYIKLANVSIFLKFRQQSYEVNADALADRAEQKMFGATYHELINTNFIYCLTRKANFDQNSEILSIHFCASMKLCTHSGIHLQAASKSLIFPD